ncbi:hypothetical protein BDY19DRAFT_994429 [Irpex rosettiformis]|uniref:Uncharacterized protein n=1 Tax=Irpex rosettiformis TaxID=378272 RepID=A0ACB8U194_9APHY|nr:hypothetical protein BDY19DRAFT_994429 [Irpex rosettiformis]
MRKILIIFTALAALGSDASSFRDQGTFKGVYIGATLQTLRGHVENGKWEDTLYNGNKVVQAWVTEAAKMLLA